MITNLPNDHNLLMSWVISLSMTYTRCAVCKAIIFIQHYKT